MNKHIKCALKVSVASFLCIPFLLLFVVCVLLSAVLTIPWIVAELSGCLHPYSNPPVVWVGELFGGAVDAWRNL